MKNQPAWIAYELDSAAVRAICKGGCASGAYMPAVIYHTALATMADYGDEILNYIEDCCGEIPAPKSGESWEGMACHYVSLAVELWAAQQEDEGHVGWNVPDDWNSYYSKCGYCGSRVHASEGGCGCLEDAGQCEYCRSSVHNRYGSLAEQEGWHPLDDLTEIGGKLYCEEHATCECCEAGEGGNEEEEEEVAKLKWHEDADQLLCPACWEEDHYCEAKGPLLDHMSQRVEAAE